MQNCHPIKTWLTNDYKNMTPTLPIFNHIGVHKELFTTWIIRKVSSHTE